MTNKGKLYLIPTPVSKGTDHTVLPSALLETLRGLNYYLVENERSARRFLGRLHLFESVEALSFATIDKDTTDEAIIELLAPAMKGSDMGLLSEAGAPAVADPGAKVVAFAHAVHVRVVPLVGPSSLILALMASGLNGQQFAFHGYLPIHEREAAAAIRQLDQESAAKHQTQMLIEAPHRNRQMLDRLRKYLRPSTRLCVALDVTGEEEFIYTDTVEEWKDRVSELPKLPCLFLFQA